MVKCVGCGAIIQSEDQQKKGYTPLKIIQERKDEIYCYRCFRLRNYGEYKSISLEENDYLQKVSKIANEDALILFVVDILDMYGSFINGLSRIIGGNDIILVANKIDLLPKSIKMGKIVHWLKKYTSDNDLKVIDFVPISAKQGTHLDDAIDRIKRYANGRDVYVVGATNTGKSTFINQLIKKYTDEKADILTVGKFAGTTLDFVEIPLGKKNSIIDTPGLINKRQVGHYLEKPSLDKITPKTTIKPMVYQLREQQSLFFGGMVRFDFVRGLDSSFVCYFSNELYIHRTKLERASEVFDKMLGKELTPPSETERANLGKMVKRSFKIPETGEYDIVISGLGFVNIKGNNLLVDVYLYEKMDVMIRLALI